MFHRPECASGKIGVPFAVFLVRENMTPEELDRAIDFIVQSQARLAVAQEEDREWSRQLFGQMAADRIRMLELIERHSVEIEDYRAFHKEALARLDRILDKLTNRENN
jgi:hypothetical protein